MFDTQSLTVGALSPGALQTLIDSLAAGVPGADAKTLGKQLGLLERAKSAICAAQAKVTVAFVDARKAEQRAKGVHRDRVGVGIAAEVGIIKGESHHRAQQYLGFARILITELPATFAAMQRGEVSEWRCMLVARETGWLSLEDRSKVDAAVGAKLGAWGNRRVAAETRQRAYQLDPNGAVNRIRRAPNDRRVTIRPAPDLMARLSALVPMKQGVAAFAALSQAADTARAGGDGRSRGQVMADTFVERITGQVKADDVSVRVNLIMGPGTFFDAGDDKNDPATVDGYGPVPADIARDLAYGSTDNQATALIRRLYTDPGTGQLVTMETRSRLFTEAQREFFRIRDQTCRMPYCDAPIRHADHVEAAEHGGPTSLANGQGLCEACNHARQAPGWSFKVHPDGDIEYFPPTGATHRSRAPSLTRAA